MDTSEVIAAQREEIQRLTEERDAALAAVKESQRVMAEFKHIYPDGFPGDLTANPEQLASQVTFLCNQNRCTFQNFVEATAELSALRAELAEAKDTLKEHEEEHWCFNAEHGQVIIERDRLRAELEAVKAAEGEL